MEASKCMCVRLLAQMRKWFYRRWVLREAFGALQELLLSRSCSFGCSPRIRFEFSWSFVFFHGLYCFRCGCVSWEFQGVSGRRLHALSPGVLSSILMKWHSALLQRSRKKTYCKVSLPNNNIESNKVSSSVASRSLLELCTSTAMLFPVFPLSSMTAWN